MGYDWTLLAPSPVPPSHGFGALGKACSCSGSFTFTIVLGGDSLFFEPALFTVAYKSKWVTYVQKQDGEGYSVPRWLRRKKLSAVGYGRWLPVSPFRSGTKGTLLHCSLVRNPRKQTLAINLLPKQLVDSHRLRHSKAWTLHRPNCFVSTSLRGVRREDDTQTIETAAPVR